MNLIFALTCRPRRTPKPSKRFPAISTPDETHAKLMREIEFETGRIAQHAARSERFRKTGELA